LSIDFTTEFLGLPSFKICRWERLCENQYIAYVDPVQTDFHCPLCGQESMNHQRPGQRLLRHRFVPSWGTVFVSIPRLRQRCDHCSLTWTVEWEEIPTRGNFTFSFREMCVQMCHGRDIQSVSKQLQISYTTLERWFYADTVASLAQPENHPAPVVICLDEFALLKGHRYGLNLMDARTGHVWQITQGRSREKILAALRSWPFAVPPQVVVTDLAPGMAETVHQVWRDSVVVADKFHVCQLFGKALEVLRKRSAVDRSHRRGRHEQRLLHTDPSKLSNDERTELTAWLSQDQQLAYLYNSLQEFRAMYNSLSYEEGKKAFYDWLENYAQSTIVPVRKIATTLLKWRNEIIAYFTYRVTNARIEGTHNRIKVLKRRAYGYRNIRRFATRIRLECQAA
jgi:transposase